MLASPNARHLAQFLALPIHFPPAALHKTSSYIAGGAQHVNVYLARRGLHSLEHVYP